MPAVKLLNIAASIPAPEFHGAAAMLHQENTERNGVLVKDGKPFRRDPTATLALDPGPVFTTFGVPSHGSVFDGERMVDRELSPADQARLIVHDWAMHSDCATPPFVVPASDTAEDKALAEAVTARFNQKSPTEKDAEAYGEAFNVAGYGSKATAAWAYLQRAVGLTARVWVPGEEGAELSDTDLIQLLAATERERWEALLKHINGPTALLLNGGRDKLFDQHFTSGAQPAAFNYVSVTANTTAPVASDTTLTGEITTAGGGLYPKQGTYAHTTSASTATLTTTFTTNGTDSLPVTLGQVGVRNASAAGGTLGTKTLLSSTATLSTSGDAVTITHTFTNTPS